MGLRGRSYSYVWLLQPHLKPPQTACPPPLCPRKSLGLPPGMTAAKEEGVGRKWFVEKDLFYCNYLGNMSWRGRELWY